MQLDQAQTLRDVMTGLNPGDRTLALLEAPGVGVAHRLFTELSRSGTPVSYLDLNDRDGSRLASWAPSLAPGEERLRVLSVPELDPPDLRGRATDLIWVIEPNRTRGAEAAAARVLSQTGIRRVGILVNGVTDGGREGVACHRRLLAELGTQATAELIYLGCLPRPRSFLLNWLMGDEAHQTAWSFCLKRLAGFMGIEFSIQSRSGRPIEGQA